jgi:hypothetical protein
MNTRHIGSVVFVLMLGILILGCWPTTSIPCVEVRHSPVIARSNDNVAFTASVCSQGGASFPAKVDIYVNDISVHTCTNLSAGASCTYTGGPYTSYISTTVSYKAVVINADGKSDARGEYYFGITDGNYGWSRAYVPARIAGSDTEKIDFIFHRAPDYTSVDQFVTHVGQKINDIYRGQSVIRERNNIDRFNFYIYSNAAQSAGSCGGDIHRDASVDMPWKNVDAVLHAQDLQDCSSVDLHHFSAEGTNTKAFLHESGHAVFGLADEYDAGSTCYTYYFEPNQEPNIFSTEQRCKDEQLSKGRNNTRTCREFTQCQNGDGDGWWQTNAVNDNTVMQRGMVNDPWGSDGIDRVDWAFAHPPAENIQGAESNSVILVHIEYKDGKWSEGSKGVRVLPCHPPTPILTGAPTNPLIQVKSADGTVIYRQNIVLDPRIILWPDPSDMTDLNTLPSPPYMLNEISFDLALPVLSGTATLEYLVPVDAKGVQTSEGPALTVDLSQSIRQYEETGGAKEAASCQLQQYKPDALK